MPRKNIKRPRPNSRKKKRARYLKELSEKKFSNVKDQLILPAQTDEMLHQRLADMAFGLGGEGSTAKPIVLSDPDRDKFLEMMNQEEPSPQLTELMELTKKLEAVDGSDTRLLDDLRAGGHPIATEDAEGNLIIEETKEEDAAGVAGDTT